MPCVSDYPEDRARREDEARRKMERLEAVLCALVKAHGIEKLVRDVNWVEAGVAGSELARWWTEHSRRDSQRKAEVARVADDARLRRQARAKLTPAERRALGLRD